MWYSTSISSAAIFWYVLSTQLFQTYQGNSTQLQLNFKSTSNQPQINFNSASNQPQINSNFKFNSTQLQLKLIFNPNFNLLIYWSALSIVFLPILVNSTQFSSIDSTLFNIWFKLNSIQPSILTSSSWPSTYGDKYLFELT